MRRDWHFAIIALCALVLAFGGIYLSFNEQFPSVEKAWVVPIHIYDTQAKFNSFNEAGISPDGRLIYSAEGDRSNVETGEVRHVFPATQDSFVMSPDGRYIFYGTTAKGLVFYDTTVKDFYSKVGDRTWGGITDFSPDSIRAANIYNGMVETIYKDAPHPTTGLWRWILGRRSTLAVLLTYCGILT